jgi:hypothetical protein
VVLLFPYLVALLPKVVHSKLPLWASLLLAALQVGGEFTVLGWIGLRVGACRSACCSGDAGSSTGWSRTSLPT